MCKRICSQHLKWILSRNSCLPRKEGLLIALSLRESPRALEKQDPLARSRVRFQTQACLLLEPRLLPLYQPSPSPSCSVLWCVYA